MLKKNIIKKFFTSKKEIEKRAGVREGTIYEVARSKVGEERMDKILDVIYKICVDILCNRKPTKNGGS